MLTSAEVLAHCLAKPGAVRDTPWEDDLVAKVGGKIFVFLGRDTVGVKCGRDREGADEWLRRYPEDAKVMAYIGRYGWNTITVDGAVPADEVLEAIDASYADVVAKLPKKHRPGNAP